MIQVARKMFEKTSFLFFFRFEYTSFKVFVLVSPGMPAVPVLCVKKKGKKKRRRIEHGPRY